MWQDRGWPWKGKTPKDWEAADSDPGHMVKSHMTVIGKMESYERFVHFELAVVPAFALTVLRIILQKKGRRRNIKCQSLREQELL